MFIDITVSSPQHLSPWRFHQPKPASPAVSLYPTHALYTACNLYTAYNLYTCTISAGADHHLLLSVGHILISLIPTPFFSVTATPLARAHTSQCKYYTSTGCRQGRKCKYAHKGKGVCPYFNTPTGCTLLGFSHDFALLEESFWDSRC
jgi:hypothetical protein